MKDIEILVNPEISEEWATGIASLYISHGWGSAYDTNAVQAAWNKTSFRAIAVQAGTEVIGALRGFSDDHFCSWLSEIVVARQHQRHGVGHALMTTFVQRFAHTAIYAEALSKDHSAAFLKRFGLLPKETLVACARAARPQK
jgi:GNAT superfamily N-acetyltransferase